MKTYFIRSNFYVNILKIAINEPNKMLDLNTFENNYTLYKEKKEDANTFFRNK